MITEKERREAAKGFREEALRYEEGNPEATVFNAPAKFERDLRALLGLDEQRRAADDLPVYEILGRIADLIERPTCRLVEDEEGCTACSECGCTALCMSSASFCPDCGAEVVRDED